MNNPNKILLCITGLLIAVVFYLFGSVVPYYSDDWWYTFVHESDRSYPTHSVATVSDVIVSQVNHYNTVNGRLPVTFLVQLVVTFCPKWLFDMLNALVFAITSYLVVLHVSPSSLSVKRLIASAVALFLLLPGHYETMMWATGAINYMWVAAYILAILLLWRRLGCATVSAWWYPLIFVAGVLAGWSNEALSLGLVAGIIVELYCMRRQHISSSQWTLASGIVVGVLMIIVAPGSWNRMGGVSYSDNINLYIPIMGAMLLPLLLCIALYCSYRRDRQHTLFFVLQYRLWLTASMILIPVCLVTYQYATRSFFGVALYALIPLLALLDFRFSGRGVGSSLLTRILFLAVAVYIAVLYMGHSNNEKFHRQLIESYVHSSNGVVACDYKPRASYIAPYTLDVDAEYSTGWTAHHMAAYYRHVPLQWMSTSLHKALTAPEEFFIPAHKIEGNAPFYTTDELDVYVLHPDSAKLTSLHYTYRAVSCTDDVPLHSKLLRCILPDSYPATQVLSAYYITYSVNGCRYHCIEKTRYRNVTAINIP